MNKSLDWNKPIVLRNGAKVKVFDDIKGTKPYIKIGAYETNKGTWISGVWTEDGEYSTPESNFDIVNVPEKVTLYLNIYRTHEPSKPFVTSYLSKEEANVSFGLSKRNKCLAKALPVEFEEGYGL